MVEVAVGNRVMGLKWCLGTSPIDYLVLIPRDLAKELMNTFKQSKSRLFWGLAGEQHLSFLCPRDINGQWVCTLQISSLPSGCEKTSKWRGFRRCEPGSTWKRTGLSSASALACRPCSSQVRKTRASQAWERVVVQEVDALIASMHFFQLLWSHLL